MSRSRTLLFIALSLLLLLPLVGTASASTTETAPTDVSGEESSAGAKKQKKKDDVDSSPITLGNSCGETDECMSIAVAEADPEDAPAEGPNTLSASGSGWWATCSGLNMDPHYSSGAGGVIFKTDINCKGEGVVQVNIRYQGHLQFAPSIGCYDQGLQWQTRATADYYQWVGVSTTGIVKRFYTPKTGHGGEGLGYWKASATWYFYHNGVRSTIGSHHKTVCKDLRP